MYAQARVFIKTALLYLALAFLDGGLLLLNQALNLSPQLGALLPGYYHLLSVGWLTQLICGVALWMFPPFSRSQPRGDERLGWICYGLLNTGLILRVIGEPARAWWGGWGWALALAALLQAAGIWMFVIAIWPRVRGRSAAAPRPHTQE